MTTVFICILLMGIMRSNMSIRPNFFEVKYNTQRIVNCDLPLKNTRRMCVAYQSAVIFGSNRFSRLVLALVSLLEPLKLWVSEKNFSDSRMSAQ